MYTATFRSMLTKRKEQHLYENLPVGTRLCVKSGDTKAEHTQSQASAEVCKRTETATPSVFNCRHLTCNLKFKPLLNSWAGNANVS